MTADREKPHDVSARTAYLLASSVDWMVLLLLAVPAVSWLGLSIWIALGLVAAWIVKDLLMYPFMRRYYEPQPSPERIVGADGEALSPIDPAGFARVRGELWQAHIDPDEPPIAAGARVRVRGIDGLRLLVEPAADAAATRAGGREPSVIPSAHGRPADARSIGAGARRSSTVRIER